MKLCMNICMNMYMNRYISGNLNVAGYLLVTETLENHHVSERLYTLGRYHQTLETSLKEPCSFKLCWVMVKPWASRHRNGQRRDPNLLDCSCLSGRC